MSFLKIGLGALLVNSVSAFNSWLGYKCVIAGHEGFAIAFMVIAYFTFVTWRVRS